MTQNKTVEFKFDLPEGRNLSDYVAGMNTAQKNELTIAMNAEVESFSDYLRSLNMDRLVPSERSLLKTFIAWKAFYEPKASNNA